MKTKPLKLNEGKFEKLSNFHLSRVKGGIYNNPDYSKHQTGRPPPPPDKL